MPKPLFTPIERRIYFLLCRKAMSARQLMEHLWLHEQDRPAKGLKQHLCNLRRKLKPMEQTIGCTISSSFGESIYYWRRLSKDGILTYSPRDLGGDDMARITLEDLEAAGLTDKQIVAIIKNALARRREQNRIAKQNQRSRQPRRPDRADRADILVKGTNGHDLERKPGESLESLARRLADHARERELTDMFGREVDADRGH